MTLLAFSSSSLRFSFIFLSLASLMISLSSCFGLPTTRRKSRVYNSGTRRGCRACSFQFVAQQYQVCNFYHFRFSYVTSLEFYNRIHISQIVVSTPGLLLAYGVHGREGHPKGPRRLLGGETRTQPTIIVAVP